AEAFRRQLEEVARLQPVDRLKELEEHLLSDVQQALDPSLERISAIVAQAPEEIRAEALLQDKQFRELVYSRLREQISALLPAVHTLKELFDPSNLDREFSREELVGVLK